MKILVITWLLLAALKIQAEIIPEKRWNFTRNTNYNVTKERVNYDSTLVTKVPANITEESNKTNKVVVGPDDCAFRITGDLYKTAPLFATHGKIEWLIPNINGIMEIKYGQYMDMHCTNSFSKPFANRSAITAQCLQGQYFLVNGQKFHVNNFSCLDYPVYTARRSGRKCNGGTDLLAIGFVVSKGFFSIMDICYDEINEVTRYAHHIIYPSSDAHQQFVARPRFIESDFYAGKNVDNIYTKVQQNETFSKILNMDASPYFNYSDSIFISRGHLAAKSDFIMGNAQRATFFFVNAAPQWFSFNSGNWERVEFGIRKYALNNNLTLECYTGIWGVSKLPDINGAQQELYLAFDENNNGLIPVPKIYFRVVIEPITRQGIVLIGVNNPHASLQQIKEEYIICEDIGREIDWINWDKENLYKGYSYACSVPDFLRSVKNLPLTDLATTGVLGIHQVGCSLRVTGDLSDQAPLLAKAGEYDWVHPASNGLIELNYGQSLDMYCSDSFIMPFENKTKITAQCLKGYEYLINDKVYDFKSFRCKTWPKYTANHTVRSCNGGTNLLQVGFEVDKGFLQTMDVCHDEINEVTRYVHHILTPSNIFHQRSVARPDFTEGGFYQGKKLNKLYSQQQQNITFSKILKVDASPYFDINKNIFLARGHLAAKSDFILASPQRSSFFYVNIAPQWHCFNSGNWQRIEFSVQKYVANQNLTVDCYTGTWGIATLPDINGRPQELYLAFDDNNNGLIPVPKLYYRVVIDRKSRKGIVLLGVNNPHASWQEIQDEYIICKDVGLDIDWINWSKENLLKGYSYACSVPDFLETVKDLPLENLNTLGVLGVDELPEEDLE